MNTNPVARDCIPARIQLVGRFCFIGSCRRWWLADGTLLLAQIQITALLKGPRAGRPHAHTAATGPLDLGNVGRFELVDGAATTLRRVAETEGHFQRGTHSRQEGSR